MDQEDAAAIGREHHAAAGDVAGSELVAGEGVGGTLEEVEDEFEAFERPAPSAGSWKERARAATRLGVEHKMKKPPV